MFAVPARLPFRFSLQTKLILSLLAVVITCGLGAVLVGKVVINHNIVTQAYNEAGQNLDVIEDVYATRLYIQQRLIASLTAYPEFQKAVAEGRRERIQEILLGLKEPGFDALNVADASGRVLVRARNFPAWGDSVSDDRHVKAALRDLRPAIGFDVMDADALARESPHLAGRAVIPLAAHRPASEESGFGPSGQARVEARGMVLKVAAPILLGNAPIGVIYGIFLVNNDTTILDRARHLLGGERIDGREVASATVFLEGLRISTTVRDDGGRRAIGTTVSPQVYQRVFVESQSWRDRADVLGHWVIAAYKPIRDIDGQTIGILYSGLAEEKFERLRDDTNRSFFVMIVFSGLLSLFLAAYLVHHFIRPIGALVGAAEEVTAGNYPKVDIRTSDEMGYLGRVFNTMVEALERKDRKFMEDVEKRIERSEKLAVLGRLSSGIAHEINNPLTGVLAFTDVLLETLEGTEHEADLQVIKAETLRCRDIVRGMLDFARETTLERSPADINRIIEEILLILKNHISFQNVVIERHLTPDLPDIPVDINQIKSVLSNLAVNAADAMPAGGRLTIGTRLSPDGKYIHVQVSDTGIGIAEENLLKIFDPFFTTKETGKGTGLGLSVTFGIVKRHNGFINVKSKVGVGTRFDIHLPLNPEEQQNE